MNTYQNPIIPGFYPDPSVCRVGDDYYLVTSTFEYFPGLPIFHSRDLVHWRQIGHVLDRPSQLNLDGVRPSHGLFAPTIRYHEGTFYVINTLVGGTGSTYQERTNRNFIVTASDPAGDWSEPYWLDNAPGIDPSLLFDDDGRAWYTGNRTPPGGAAYSTHREIWLQELDLATMQLTGDVYALWDGALKEATHAEAPHLYKIDGSYYLMIAEGGTEWRHSVTIARSEQVTGPYQACMHNPLMTHRHRGKSASITGTGHADLFETQNGDWWIVMLAMRPYGGYFYNLGRETFMAPVIWEDGWPLISPETGKIEDAYPVPDLPAHPWPQPPACDHFEAATLDFIWNMLRTPRETFWSLDERPGYLRLKLRPERISDWVNPSFIGRRQQHKAFAARTVMDFMPQNEHESAGVVLLQNSDFQFRCEVKQVDGQRVVQLIRREAGEESLRGQLPVSADRLYLKVTASGQDYSFYIAEQAEQWLPLAENEDGRILSTPVAGGFVGAYIGMYASSNGQSSDNHADFDWFEYIGD